MPIHSPELCFKGERTYVHGTTLYEAVLQGATATGFAAPNGKLTIDFRKRLVDGADIHYRGPEAADAPDADIGDAAGTFRLTCGGAKVRGCILSNGAPVSRRILYNEMLIREVTGIEGAVIHLAGDPPFQPFEACAAMSVHLHNNLFPPPAGEKWMLTQLKLADQFTRTDIGLGNGQVLGSMTFMFATI